MRIIHAAHVYTGLQANYSYTDSRSTACWCLIHHDIIYHTKCTSFQAIFDRLED